MADLSVLNGNLHPLRYSNFYITVRILFVNSSINFKHRSSDHSFFFSYLVHFKPYGTAEDAHSQMRFNEPKHHAIQTSQG
jgi:hypothetical protein